MATLKPPDTKLQQAPDGSFFQVEPGASGGWWTGRFLDRLGQPVRAGALPTGVLGGRDVWADDSRHVCLVANDPADQSWRLIVAGPGAAARVVGVIALDSEIAHTFAVAACSLKLDRAVVLRTTSSMASNQVASWTSDLWVVRLSNGIELAHHVYTAGRIGKMIASSDASYVAENSQITAGSGGRSATSLIRRVSDWTPTRTLAAAVEAFSGDGSLALVVPAALAAKAGSRHALAVVDWRSVTTRWQETTTDYYQGFAVRPAWGDFAIARGNLTAIGCPVASWVCTSPVQITIVRGNGSTIRLPDRHVPAW